MSEQELSKDEKIALVLESGKVVGGTAAILAKLSGADLDEILKTPFPPKDEVVEKKELTSEEKFALYDSLKTELGIESDSKELTEEEELELQSKLNDKYPIVEDEREENEIIVENRRLKQQMVNREKVISLANSIVLECSKK